MAFTIVEDEAPITNATVDLTPYKEVVEQSKKASKTLGIMFDTEKEAKVAQGRFRSAADQLGHGLRTEITETDDGKWKVRLFAKDRRSYTISPEKVKERTAKAAATRAAKKAEAEKAKRAEEAAKAPAPKGSRPSRRNA